MCFSIIVVIIIFLSREELKHLKAACFHFTLSYRAVDFEMGTQVAIFVFDEMSGFISGTCSLTYVEVPKDIFLYSKYYIFSSSETVYSAPQHNFMSTPLGLYLLRCSLSKFLCRIGGKEGFNVLYNFGLELI
jgi:hypothetical protein